MPLSSVIPGSRPAAPRARRRGADGASARGTTCPPPSAGFRSGLPLKGGPRQAAAVAAAGGAAPGPPAGWGLCGRARRGFWISRWSVWGFWHEVPCIQSFGFVNTSRRPASHLSMYTWSRTAPGHARRAHPRVQILPQVRGLGPRAQEALGGSSCVCVGGCGVRPRYSITPLQSPITDHPPNPPSFTFTHQQQPSTQRPGLRRRGAGAVRLGPG